MMRRSWVTALGVGAAIVITTAMDAQGMSDFSALPLCPLMLLFWYLNRLSRREMGFVLGSSRHYLLALFHPLLVIGLAAAIALLAGATNPAGTDWPKALTNLGLVAVSTILIAIVTEEGFFRGWLWGALSRSTDSSTWLLALSSLAFAAWHMSAVLLPTGFAIPPQQVPVYLLNTTLMGAIWGVLRWHSGSVVVASVSHGIWNGLAYSLFGFGAHVGALGISETAMFGPEAGVIGLALNAVFLTGLLAWLGPRLPRPPIHR